MPIMKRGGGIKKVSRPNHSKPKAKKPAPKPAPVKKAEPPKTPPRTSHIKKRKPLQSEYVYWDGDELVVRTPKECTRWSHDFRLRIIRDYVPPKTSRPGRHFKTQFLDNGFQERTYQVQGHTLSIRQPFEILANSTSVVVLRTDVYDHTTGRKMFLKHDHPAMRILMVYEFICQKEIGGVPSLRIAPLDAEW